jgi:beta-glucuronidase
MPKSLIKRDIDIIRDMNCNAIRTSHYPNSQWTIDYCDEVGILFWAEIPMWNLTQDATRNELTHSRAISMEREMIEENYHHPSIVFWGMHNECATDTEDVYRLTEKMVKTARELDSSRLITYATNKVRLDVRREICFDLCDVVSLNHYIGWYFPLEDGDWNDFMKEYEDVLASTNSIDKPFVMSEFGFGAIPGVNSFDAGRWSEDYQADALEFTLNELLNNERMSGGYIWQFADIRTEQDNLGRPRGFNNKGILDEYRRPKRAYRTVRKIYGEHLGIEREHYSTILLGTNPFKK